MTAVRLSAAASVDVEQAFDHYLDNAGADTALRWLDAVDDALRHLEQHPASGSRRYAEHLDLPGLRFWLTTGFPYALFYLEIESAPVVIRVLHQHADLPQHLR